jgi:hypothetical protein
MASLTNEFIKMDNKTNFFQTTGFASVDYSGKHLSDVGAKKGVFEGCNFSYCVLDRGYFHGATFTNCKFVGTRFVNCNFRSAKFVRCDFSYSSFDHTYLARGEVEKNLPYQPNIRRDLLRALRANAVTMGDQETNSSLISLELLASTQHHWEVAKRASSYYEKYSALERISSLFSYLGLRLENLIWGFGLSPSRLLFWVILAIALSGVAIAQASVSGASPIEILSGVKYAAFGILDLALVPAEVLNINRTAFAALVAVRTIAIGLLITIIYRRYAR